MNIVFFGTPLFAARVLEELFGHQAEDGKQEDIHVAGVVTRQDAKSKRGNDLVPSPVKEVACKAGLPLIEANKADKDLIERVRAFNPDYLVVAAYGALLPPELLALPKREALNIHASLLPRWRGAAPIERAILAADEKTGVSIMRMVSALDAGPYCAQAELAIGEKTASELEEELAHLGARQLIKALQSIEDKSALWYEQKEEDVTYAKKIKKEEMRLSPEKTLSENLRIIQASSQHAPARATINKKRGARILKARPYVCDQFRGQSDAVPSLRPGDVVLSSDAPVFMASDGAFEILELIPDGKRRMAGAEFARGLVNLSEGRALSWS